MNWENVKAGDTVKIKYKDNATVQGAVIGISQYAGHTFVSVGGLGMSIQNCELLEHTPGYKDGDIGVYTSDQAIYVGIYDSKAAGFRTSTLEYSAVMFRHRPGIKIVGNING